MYVFYKYSSTLRDDDLQETVETRWSSSTLIVKIFCSSIVHVLVCTGTPCISCSSRFQLYSCTPRRRVIITKECPLTVSTLGWWTQNGEDWRATEQKGESLEDSSAIFRTQWHSSCEISIKSVSSILTRPTQHHKCSNIDLFLIYATCFGRQSRPSSRDITKM
jgi:hypothetical protein